MKSAFFTTVLCSLLAVVELLPVLLTPPYANSACRSNSIGLR